MTTSRHFLDDGWHYLGTDYRDSADAKLKDIPPHAAVVYTVEWRRDGKGLEAFTTVLTKDLGPTDTTH
ncbi:hypothetical protein PL263_17905 [Methylomonas sp. EFPC3]|uniref:hypothetical protein n=1 Tax=Methylomonas sp. EFPC3 TaxID=3021710 RepID=UPI0024166FFB|nr:hypothetical protein [Methylomonas sp. EFPC3]WFP48489.1 hypothetical protein PL263_10220 [Methylomonas sp. EFPC3]WFP49962.1 hypothetical protein PL263_17905 [Methylomonas sp. EFPC3]